MVPVDVATLFAMAIALLNRVGFTSSREKVEGSVLVLDQGIVTDPPEVALVGTEVKVRAETNGRKKRMTPRIERIVCEWEDIVRPVVEEEKRV